jgi:FKBP-type peptidyl-prolyl cis-trans isomerase 2
MAQAKNGDTVKVHYTGKLEDGTVFDSSRERDPLEFTLGQGQIIPGFEEAVVGMSPGESTSAEVPADKAYGPHNKELIVEVNREQFPEHLDPQPDQQLQMRRPDGQIIVVKVTDVSETNVTLDANHPLAGEDLTFDIELVEIV